MSGKYGRLFTERDVERIVDVAHAHGCDADEALRLLDSGRGGAWSPRFPADEPLFLLRGQDKAVLDALIGGQDYEDACADAGAGEEHLAAVQIAADEITAWQRANPDRVKVPD